VQLLLLVLLLEHLLQLLLQRSSHPAWQDPRLLLQPPLQLHLEQWGPQLQHLLLLLVLLWHSQLQ
jgi:hypothetical protein